MWTRQDWCQSSRGCSLLLARPLLQHVQPPSRALRHIYILYTLTVHATCTSMIPTMWSDTHHPPAHQFALHGSSVEQADTDTLKRSPQDCLTCAWTVVVLKNWKLTTACSFLQWQTVTRLVIAERAGKTVDYKQVNTLLFRNRVRYRANEQSVKVSHVRILTFVSQKHVDVA